MLMVLYYIFWVLLALIYGLFIFTVWKFYKNKKPILKYIVPLSLNAFISFIGSFLILFSIGCLLVDTTNWWKHLLLFLGSIIFITMPNILLYRLYYKRKNKLTKKEYCISSFYGLAVFILYIVQTNLMGAVF